MSKNEKIVFFFFFPIDQLYIIARFFSYKQQKEHKRYGNKND